jgi:rhodanese-related sulfurtransferase
MHRLILTTILLSIFNFLPAQYKNDNVLFRTVFPQDLCKALEKNHGYLLLDVRSPGEYNDTSSSTGLNLGHLDGAMNIDIRQIGGRLNEIAAYKNKPVFVYCSHSQRSRRVSKMLADSGFTNVNNINGGMTAIRSMDEMQSACIRSMIVSSNSYSVVAPATVCNKLSKNSNAIYLLDVRPDSAWDHIAANPKLNAYGYLKGTTHIALSNLKSKLNEIPRNKEIIVTDLFGGDAALAAQLLRQSEFEHVSVMLEGIDRWIQFAQPGSNCNKDLYIKAVPYDIMGTTEFSVYYPSIKNALVLDIRSNEEFENRHSDSYRNIGRIKNAVHIPSSEISNRLKEIEAYKSSPVILYAFSGSPDTYAVANLLAANGFKDIKVLAGGLFNLRWTASNVNGLYFMHDWVENIPDENK